MPTPEFIHAVRSALTHLYDNAFLQNHPLGYLLLQNAPPDNLTRSQTLRRSLLDAIEQLRPQPHSPTDSARAYAILSYRCVDGLAMEEIEQKLALSRRQTYREYSKGVEAVASQLWDRIDQERVARELPVLSTPLSETGDQEWEKLPDDLHIEQIFLSDVLQGVCNLLKNRLLAKAVQIETSAPPGLQLQADRTLLRQSLLILLGSALDRLSEEGTIRIEAQQAESEIVLSMVAIPCAETPLVSAALEETKVAQSLLEVQQGRLAFDAQPHSWSASIHLPLSARPVDCPSILLVDDNEDLLTLFRRFLAGHRINVISASSSHDALELASKLQPNLIVLDVMMPYADGWDVLQALRSDPQTGQIPVIICSVLKERSLALSLGANDYLSKPVSQSQLLDVLPRWLGTLRPRG